MVKRMLIDATHPEETRVVVLNGNRLEEFDFESSTKKQLKGNIYLAKVTRVEPSLQAAFVDYGGNRHGFLAFNEIHPDYYRIPVADREALIAEARAAERDREAEQDAQDAAREAAARDGHPHGAAPASDGGDPMEAAYTPVETGGSEAPLEGDDHHPAGDDGAPVAWGHPGDPAAEHAAEPQATHAEAALDDHAGTSAHDHVHDHDHDHDHDHHHDHGEADAYDRGHHAHDEANRDHGTDAPGDASGSGPRAMAAEGGRDMVVAEPRGRGRNGDGEPVEELGGDELEEVAPRRHRNFRNYKIQEVVTRRQIMLVQVVKEERGTKGAALTTYLSLAGRYCVLMPNTPRGGGVSRKITSMADRKRLKSMLDELDIPEGMAVIVRTAGMERSKAEIKRDYEYLLRLWDEIRALTLESSAPALIHEEGNLIKRTIRDLYSRDIDEVLVDGEEGYKMAKAFMKMIVPSHAKRVQPYRDPTVPLLHRYQIESQLDAIHNPTVQLKSGGYIVLNQTEALVAIDVNSGRATRERHIEETALKTNLEAADEIARQVRLRDLAGLIVIDFIDMEENRNNHAVERRVKEAMKHDRARIQIGRISPFGLLELSRQRLRPSLAETSTERCPHCNGSGVVRSTESTALHVLRAIEEEGIRMRSTEIMVYMPTAIALYIFNHKRSNLAEIEARYGFHVLIGRDDSLVPPEFRLERLRQRLPGEALPTPVMRPIIEEPDDDDVEESDEERLESDAASAEDAAEEGTTTTDGGPRKRRRSRRKRRGGPEGSNREDASLGGGAPSATESSAELGAEETGEDLEDDDLERDGETPAPGVNAGEETAEGARKRRRRGKRGGRRRNRRPNEDGLEGAPGSDDTAAEGPNGYGGSADDAAHGPSPVDQPAAPQADVPRPYDVPQPYYAEPRAAEIGFGYPPYAPPALDAPATPAAPAWSVEPAPARPEHEAPAPHAQEPAPSEPDAAPPRPAPIVEPAHYETAPMPSHSPEPTPPAQAAQPVPGVDVVIVDQPTENPRKGWWRRLTK